MKMIDRMNKESVYKILRLALGGEVADFGPMSAHEWNWAFNTLSLHGLSALGCVAIEKLPVDLRPSKEVLLKFITADMSTQQSYTRLKKLADKIEVLLLNAKSLLLKFSLKAAARFLSLPLNLFTLQAA